MVYPLRKGEYIMALYVKDPEVDRLASELADTRNTTKTEALKQSLKAELRRHDDDDFVRRAVAFAREMRAKGNPDLIQTVDKAYIDSLYED
jgi:antitoxin VapB